MSAAEGGPTEPRRAPMRAGDPDLPICEFGAQMPQWCLDCIIASRSAGVEIDAYFGV